MMIFHLLTAADIVFDYRQKVTRSFEYLQGDYYIAPVFMVCCELVIVFISFDYAQTMNKCLAEFKIRDLETGAVWIG